MHARIDNGVVKELFTPPDGFSIGDCFHEDLIWADVTGVSPPPEPGWTASQNGPNWTFAPPPPPAPPTLAQQAASLLAAGLTIASTGTPAIDGVYACDPATRATIAEVVAGINAGDGFPGDGPTFDFVLANGDVVTFPATSVFLTAARAVRNFIYACAQVINGRSDVLPSASVTID